AASFRICFFCVFPNVVFGLFFAVVFFFISRSPFCTSSSALLGVYRSRRGRPAFSYHLSRRCRHAASRGLFVAQRGQRIDADGAARGNGTAEESGDAEHERHS